MTNNNLTTFVGIVSDLVEKTTSNSESYINFSLNDKVTKIDTKAWQTTMEEMNEKNIENGSFVIIEGKINRFKDKDQIIINRSNEGLRIRLINENDPINIDQFIKTAPLKDDIMRSYFREKISEIEDAEYKSFMEQIYFDYENKILSYPGSITVHHDYKMGLAYHMYRMLKSAHALADVYKDINRDLLTIGVLLHDIGKVKCYDVTSDGVSKGYTLENDLIGHIAIGIIILEKYELREDKKDLIRHLILSHHGKIEYGAVVPPMFKEALILHMVDNLDARMTIMEDELEKIEEGQVSDRIFFLDRAKVYKF